MPTLEEERARWQKKNKKSKPKPKTKTKVKENLEKKMIAEPEIEEKTYAREWDKDSIISLLKTNDNAVKRGLIALYKRQTADEKSTQATRVVNNIGFNKHDAKFLSSLAEQYLNKGWLSVNQIASARKSITKYWRQLVEIANQNALKEV
jgi:hypothetical protein